MKWSLSKVVFLALSICSLNKSDGQKSDYIWLSGADSYIPFDTAGFGFGYGDTKMDFNYSPVDITYDSLAMNFDFTNTSYCDSNGSLLFYTNGIYVANALDEMIENSDSLNAGYLQYVWDPSIQTGGYRNPQGIIAIQNVNKQNSYFLIYSFTDSLPGSQGADLYNPKILTAYLDMDANAGQGMVMFKNQVLISDTIGIGTEISATRHGNGRDWWILIQKRNTNCYYRILIDTSGPHLLPDLTCSDSIITQNDVGSATFSPDGSKYVYFTVVTGLKIFDFDRCSGMLSNPVHIPIDIWQDSSWLGNGVAISPNNRFLYLSATHYMVQYDLSVTDVVSSADTIGVYDGYALPFGSVFNTAQSGPDGKIYISCGNDEADYHVINNPNAKGDSCIFVQHGIRLPTTSAGVPNFPNYRLGALIGSPCDTLNTGLNEVARAAKEAILKVFPNPAADLVTVDYGFTDWSISGVVSLEIVNELGQVVYEQNLPLYSGYQKLDISKYAAGLYTAFIRRNEQVIAVQKFAKE